MGFFDFFKNIFKKQNCAFCGKECGVLGRNKIKGDEYICNDCQMGVSRYVRVGRFTKDELLGHMEYMKRCDRIFKEVLGGFEGKSDLYPLPPKEEGIQFYDDYGMFIIRDMDKERREGYITEVFRYDQVASYEHYMEDKAPAEEGKEREFVEAGVRLKLIGGLDVPGEIRKGAKAHPYITDEIKICIAKGERNKSDAMYVDNILARFDYIFGVNAGRRGLFQFGMTEEEKRNLNAGVAFVNTFVDAVKLAKEGQNAVSEEKQAEIRENMNKINDAQTGGLSVYTRRADEAEEKINLKGEKL